MSSRTRPLVWIPLLALLLAVPANATPLGDTPFLSRLWQLVTSVWAEAGCGIDPSGYCGEGPTYLEAGCGIDPSGHCGAAASTRQEGCGIDPNGNCGTAAPTLDEGCGMDPDGKCRQ